MSELLTRSFLDKHPLKEFSAARFTYSRHFYPGLEDFAADYLHTAGVDMLSFDEMKLKIQQENDLTELLRLPRKPDFPPICRAVLIKKLLEMEDTAYPEIQKRIMTSIQDHFIETAIHFFDSAKRNPADWILKDYKSVRSPYARSLLLMLLGFYGDPSVVPLLMDQVVWFEKNFPDESFSQGPLVALHEIKARIQEEKDLNGGEVNRPWLK